MILENKIQELLSNQDNDPIFAMSTAAEALDLLGHYCMDFKDRPQDQDAMASMCRIISYYLKTVADKVNPDN